MSFAGQVAAANLDAADGVMDGRSFGAPVVAGAFGGATTVGAGYGAVAPYMGNRSVVPNYGATYAPQAFPAATYGHGYAAPAHHGFAPSAYSAPASFAHHGFAPAPYAHHHHHQPAYAAPAVSYGAAPAYHHGFAAPAAAYQGAYTPSYGMPAHGAYAPASYGSVAAPHSFGGSYAAGQQAALALDAADGRIDGAFHGAPVVARH
eukprot:NODE_1877_length_874_cov_1164.106667_g1309_i0.p2 GENE.NODE_1877_length_874_cov_1164.106667_g1309_i0~~NODE_1877_length_874_cov_1164.106667_g1309_i0.p2  ORF type:complete len:228 (-),score=102.52 NODE_1877_length_874_cov_1164.106667_g1309_i0:189-803(-)